MIPSENHASIRAGIRVLQIIVGALLAGVLVFFAFVIYRIATDAGPLKEPSPVPLTWIAAGMSVVQVVVFVILRSSMRAKARRRIADGTFPPMVPAFEEAGDEGRFFQAYMTSTIVFCAGMEGGALFCLVAALIEGNPVGLAVGGLFALIMAFQIPTRAGVDHWIEDQMMRRSRGERASGRDLRS